MNKRVIPMIAFLVAAFVNLALAADTKDQNTQSSGVKATVDDRYFMKFNGILWVTFLFLYLTLSAAWKISEDNTPNTQRDSILYAKFLTQNFQQKANWAIAVLGSCWTGWFRNYNCCCLTYRISAAKNAYFIHLFVLICYIFHQYGLPPLLVGTWIK